jgi:two-component system, NarL family, nitrate/nitrite sensor histidine kinase NarX
VSPWRSVRAQFIAVFLGFLLLVASSATATFLTVRAQADDARVINLAGRQRMLTQKITWLALVEPDNPDLAASIRLFEETLHALRDGGTVLDAAGQPVTIPPAPDAALRSQLDDVAQDWAAFRSHLQPVDAQALQAQSPHILAHFDGVVDEYEARAEAKVARLQLIQIIFVVAALGLLAWGYFVTQRRLVGPLAALGTAARRIAGGNLADPVPPLAEDELGELGQAFDRMRGEVATARDQLETRVTQRTRELAEAFEFSQEIVAQSELERLLCSVVDRARALAQAQAAALHLFDEGEKALSFVASSDDGAAVVPDHRVECDLACRAVEAGRVLATQPACAACRFLLAHPPGLCAIVPLRTGETTLGALCVVRDGNNPFDPDTARALTLLANSAATAIANARLVEAGRQRAEEAAALAERERLRAELHDNLAQTLGFLNLETDRVREAAAAGRGNEADREMGRIKAAIHTAYEQVRAALTGLGDPTPAAGDLSQKLSACLDEFRQASGISVELVGTDPAGLVLSAAVQRQVVYMVREALANVRRHAHAERAWVRVEQDHREASFTVEDDGCGFNPSDVRGEHHLGLTIMRIRAERSGGQVTIDSAPGAGTRVIIRFPLNTTPVERTQP